MAIELTTAPLSTLQDIRTTLGIVSLKEIYPQGTFQFINDSVSLFLDAGQYISGGIIDVKSLQAFSILNFSGNRNFHTILNAEHLTNLKNSGTQQAFVISNHQFTQQALDQLFTDLPPAVDDGRTVTINVAGNPGALTCDPSIAQAKGYTVVTT